jgi:hypothetical protein
MIFKPPLHLVLEQTLLGHTFHHTTQPSLLRQQLSYAATSEVHSVLLDTHAQMDTLLQS